MSSRPLPRRQTVGLALLAALALLVAADIGTSAPLDPFRAPPPAALGSGAAPSGAHCAAAPT
ncbi:hypothetical protein [Salinarimonas ramus]|uniref:Uncharacterized protein n=1 Tax=Salinarimonas ramus TaxID=690164 RepID=A0A917QBA8_9HYPH|nr:hypothetical protein [Salinarimonas ramus]GGK41599.1 hypothetical protein GCM10011322_30900 [Salinarimonas ramus]